VEYFDSSVECIDVSGEFVALGGEFSELSFKVFFGNHDVAIVVSSVSACAVKSRRLAFGSCLAASRS